MLALRRAALARALTAPHRAAALRVAPLLRASLRTSAALSARKPAPPAAAPEPEADDDEEPTADVTNPKVLKEIMDKHVEYCRRELSKLRGAQASPSECVRRKGHGTPPLLLLFIYRLSVTYAPTCSLSTLLPSLLPSFLPHVLQTC